MYYIPHPVIRIQIISDNSTIHSQGHIRLGYFTENYTGYLDWDFISSTGENYSQSTYSNSHERWRNFNPPFFGDIEVCASTGTNQSSAQSCITINYQPREVSGEIVSPLNNSIINDSEGLFQMNYYVHNVSSGSIKLNGLVIQELYNLFLNHNEDHNHSDHTDENSSVVTDYSSINIFVSYGYSEICLELFGEDGSVFVDCIWVHRPVPIYSQK